MTNEAAGDSLEAALAAARSRLTAGDLDGARKLCAPVVAGTNPQLTATAHLILSACADRSGDAASARAHAESALRANPDDAVAQYAWAEIEERAGTDSEETEKTR